MLTMASHCRQPKHFLDQVQRKKPQNTGALDEYDCQVFGQGMSVNVICSRTTFSPSAPALIEISRGVFSMLIAFEPHLNEILLPEFIDYYATALLWFRIVSLKAKNSQPLTQDERNILTLLHGNTFAVPEPIGLQLRSLGNIQTMIGQHLYPEFPPIPSTIISSLGGFYGTLVEPGPKTDNTTHLFYEELPCLGVIAYAIMQTVSDRAPGKYNSIVTYNNQQPTNNLLGFKPLGYRQNESKQFAVNHGISDTTFPSYPPNCALNIDFLIAISNALANTKTFKIENIVFPTMTGIGKQVQIITTRPGLRADGQLSISGDIRSESVCKEKESEFGLSHFLIPNHFKESISETNHLAWSLFETIPNEWARNKNQRRENLPLQYRCAAFITNYRNAYDYRMNILKLFVAI